MLEKSCDTFIEELADTVCIRYHRERNFFRGRQHQYLVHLVGKVGNSALSAERMGSCHRTKDYKSLRYYFCIRCHKRDLLFVWRIFQ